MRSLVAMAMLAGWCAGQMQSASAPAPQTSSGPTAQAASGPVSQAVSATSSAVTSQPGSIPMLIVTSKLHDMAAVCGLSAEQQQKLQQMGVDLDETTAEHEAKVRAARGRYWLARREGDETATTAALQALRRLEANTLPQAALDVLTPEQRALWQRTSRLVTELDYYRGIEFDLRQAMRIAAMWEKLTGKLDSGDRPAVDGARADLHFYIEEILTDHQKELLDSVGGARPGLQVES